MNAGLIVDVTKRLRLIEFPSCENVDEEQGNRKRRSTEQILSQKNIMEHGCQ